MDSSPSATPVENSHFMNADVEEEISKLVEHTISTPRSQTQNDSPQRQSENDSPRSPIEDGALRSQVENDIERARSSVARLTSSSIDDLEHLASELQELQKLLKSEVDRVQGEIDSALAGIKIIAEAIAPWKSNAPVSLPAGARALRVGPAAFRR